MIIGLTLLLSLPCTALDPFIVPNFHPQDVMGTWSLQLVSVKHEVDLKKDQTFSGTRWENGKVTEVYDGTWGLDDRDHLTWTYQTSRSFKRGETDTDKVMARDADSLTLRTASGILRTWFRSAKSASNK